jgi:hypothetical protein
MVLVATTDEGVRNAGWVKDCGSKFACLKFSFFPLEAPLGVTTPHIDFTSPHIKSDRELDEDTAISISLFVRGLTCIMWWSPIDG